MIVAIDGGVASGKSAAGRRVAEALSLPFVDSGLMYRAMAVLVHEHGLDDEREMTTLAGATRFRIEGGRVWAGARELTDRVYDPGLNEILSRVSAIAPVRAVLVSQQRDLAAGGGLVMAGRDIGTVVFPDADFKFYLEAGLEERVRRRAAQMEKRGESLARGALLSEVAERDRADTEREASPLRAAPDAEVVNTDGLSLEEVVALVLTRVGA